MTQDTLRLYKQNDLGLFEESGQIDHVDLAEKLSPSTSKKSLAQKNSGKFYTPEAIASPLIKQIIEISKGSSNEPLKIIDPFCGDGRLIAWLLPYLKNKKSLTIYLWDYDSDAVEQASIKVKKVAEQLNLKVDIVAKKTDSFIEFFNGNEGAFDIVLTNPPWEVIKPDQNDLIHIEDEKSKQLYLSSLKEFSNRLLRDYPLSRPTKSYGGWGVNLARVGTELSIRLTKDNGIAGIVAPSSIFADQNSSELRKWIFNTNDLKNINIYPAELKLFIRVDQPSVSFVLKKSQQQQDLLVSDFTYLTNPTSHKLDDVQKLLSMTDYIFPISVASRPAYLEILSTLSLLPQLSNFGEGNSIWMGRELDETNYKSWLSMDGRYRFVKGRDIERFHQKTDSSIFVNEEALKASIPNTVNYHRIAWRDVSRPNQKRRVIATIIPPGCVTGNSLGILHLNNQQSHQNLLALLGLMSSFVFEFQLRAYLATAHVSSGVLKKITIPKWNDEMIDRISLLTGSRLNGSITSEHEMEVVIAKAYGLNKFQFEEILNAFPKVTADEKSSILNIWK